MFECEASAASKLVGVSGADKLSQIERLKKLLDTGALTQQEFESEKARILGTR